MSLPWHPLAESGDDFLASAPFRYVNTVDVPVPPDRTWVALTADDTLVSWTPLVSGLRWTTPRPFSVGTTREITLLRFVTARERYYHVGGVPAHQPRSTSCLMDIREWARLVCDHPPAVAPLGSSRHERAPD